MPRYYFHFNENGKRVEDAVGIELRSRREASRQASQTLGAIATDVLTADPDRFEGAVEVADNHGHVVMSAMLSYRRESSVAQRLVDPTPAERLSRRISRADETIARQRDLITRLDATGLPTNQARELLGAFQQAAALYRAHMRRYTHPATR
jgi:hypothetical protein